jgi:hypothetical protein
MAERSQAGPPLKRLKTACSRPTVTLNPKSVNPEPNSGKRSTTIASYFNKPEPAVTAAKSVQESSVTWSPSVGPTADSRGKPCRPT